MAPTILTVEGVPGAGKSHCLNTLVKKYEIEKEFNAIVYLEPGFTSFQGFNPLALLYSNPQKNAVRVQVYILNQLRH